MYKKWLRWIENQCSDHFRLYTLPETNSSPLKIGGWNTSFLSGWPIFRGVFVSFRECNYYEPCKMDKWTKISIKTSWDL